MFTCNVSLSPKFHDSPITALRSLRGCFNIGLREAKDIHQTMRNDGYMTMDLNYEERNHLEVDGFYIETLNIDDKTNLEYGVMLYFDFDAEVNSRIKAIKRIREATGYGLKEAKDLTDIMRDTRRPVRVGVPLNEAQIKRLENFGFKVTGTRPKDHFDNELFTV